MESILNAVYEICEGMSLAYLVLGGAVLLFLFAVFVDSFLHSPKLGFLLRWAKLWIVGAIAYFILRDALNFGGELALWAMSIWLSLALELAYLSIRAEIYSRKKVLPFFGFVACENAWRPNPKYYKLKCLIEQEGFERLASFKARDYLSLGTLFYSKKEHIALFVNFAMHRARLESFYYIFSKNEDGKYLVFCNDYSEQLLTLKGKYALHYRMSSSLGALLKIHRRRAKSSLDNFVDFELESKNLPHLLYNDNLQKGVELGAYSKNRQDGQLLTMEGKFLYLKNFFIKRFFRI